MINRNLFAVLLAMKNTNTSSFFTLLSIVLVLCLLGLYGIVTLHAGNLVDILKENMNLIVELDDSLAEETSIALMKSLQAREEIKDESVKFIPRSEAILQMKSEMGDKFLLDDFDNPFSDIIVFNVEHQYVETSALEKLKTSLLELEGVAEISYYASVYDYLKSNLRKLSLFLLIVGMILGFFAFALIYSTIQLNLYAERFKIRTMELVGASWNQIRKPFLIRSIRLAILSSFISVIILIFILIIAAIQFDYFWSVINLFYIFLVFFLISLFALMITQLASYVVVNKYLGSDSSSVH